MGKRIGILVAILIILLIYIVLNGFIEAVFDWRVYKYLEYGRI